MHSIRSQCKCKRRGFSLIELVIVVVIIAIIGAIAIPRLSRGSAGAADSAVTADLELFHKAIDMYAAEHGGNYPDTNAIVSQLTTYSDSTGATAITPDPAHIYGPYLRAIPPQPIGLRKGQSNIAAADGADVGWIYNSSTGSVTSNQRNKPADE